MNWPLLFIVGWSLIGCGVARWFYVLDRRREERELAEFRQELRESFEGVCREMVCEEREYKAKVEAATWN